MKGKISDKMHSGGFYSQTDDSSKDEDSAAWIMDLEEGERNDWIATLQFIRISDRLIESGRFKKDGKNGYSTANFLKEWRMLRADGTISEGSPFSPMFATLKKRWEKEGLSEQDLTKWDQYLDSLAHYESQETEIRTASDYMQALYRLSGPLYYALPHSPRNHSRAVEALGALDQFYNNLRDLHEDTKSGICLYPLDVMEMFRIGMDEFSSLASRPDERFARMIEYLFCDFVPDIRKEMSVLFVDEDLHYSWRILLKKTAARHSRIEYVFRRCGYNAAVFSKEYYKFIKARKLKNTS